MVTQPATRARIEALRDLPDQELARNFAALRSRGEPSVPAQLALDGLDRQLRRK